MKIISERRYPGLDENANLGINADKIVANIPLQANPAQLQTVYSDLDTSKVFAGLGRSDTYKRVKFITTDSDFTVTPQNTGWHLIICQLIVRVREYGSGAFVKIRATNGSDYTKFAHRWFDHNSDNYTFESDSELNNKQRGSIHLIEPLYLNSLDPVYVEIAAGLFVGGFNSIYNYAGDFNTDDLLDKGVEIYHQSSLNLLHTENTSSQIIDGLTKIQTTT